MKITSKLGYAIIGLIASTVFPLVLMFITGFVSPDFSRAYSGDIKGPQSQVYALCHGNIALSDNPSDLLIDYVYHDGKVQQIWGLGVALIQSLVLCLIPIPDRIFLLLVLIVTSFAVYWNVKLFCERKQPNRRINNAFIAVCAVFMFIFLPAAVSLLRTRFLIYEETVYYGYIYVVFLFLCSHVKLCSSRRAFIIGVVCGFAVLIRPTVLAYGIATLIVLLLRTSSYKLKRWLVSGFFIVCIIAALLNWYRFGSPTEFGHKINLSTNDFVNTYSLKFDYQYKNESFINANKELFGALFFVKPFISSTLPNKFPFQSDIIRWRAFYSYTFNLGYLFLFLVLSICLYIYHKKGNKIEFNLLLTQFVWLVVPGILLWGFYLYSPSVSSRYIFDFGALFSVLAIVTLVQLRQEGVISFRPLRYLCIVFIFILWVNGIRSELYFKLESLNYPISEPTVNKFMGMNVLSGMKSVYNKGDLFHDKSIFNGIGWRTLDGRTNSTVTLFFDKPRLIEVTVSGDCEYLDNLIEIRIGQDLMSYFNFKHIDNLTIYTFEIPKKYGNNIWPIFLKMLPIEKARYNSSACHLIKVENK